MSSQRQPSGVPTGGQFAPTGRSEADVDLPAVDDTPLDLSDQVNIDDGPTYVEENHPVGTTAELHATIESITQSAQRCLNDLEDDGSQYAIVEFGNHEDWVSIGGSPEGLADYHLNQEYAEDWQTKDPIIFDRVTGNRWRLQPKETLEPIAMASEDETAKRAIENLAGHLTRDQEPVVDSGETFAMVTHSHVNGAPVQYVDLGHSPEELASTHLEDPGRFEPPTIINRITGSQWEPAIKADLVPINTGR